MRRCGTAVLLLLLGGAAQADVELAAGPNLQVNKSAEGGTIGTGFLVRALHSRSARQAWGVSLEGLWLIPTGNSAATTIASQQDLLVISRYRPPVGRKEILGIDLGAGVTHYAGDEVTYHPTIQMGAAISGRLAGPLRYEIGVRLAITPNVFYADMEGPAVAPPGAAWRFGGVVTTAL